MRFVAQSYLSEIKESESCFIEGALKADIEDHFDEVKCQRPSGHPRAR